MQCPRCTETVPDDGETCSRCGSALRTALLEVVRGNVPERVHFLKPRGYSIGRARSCDLRLTEPSVSKSHARLIFEDGRFHVEDQNSLHGVFVNAEKVQRAVLSPGAQIQLGNVTLRFGHLDNEGSTGDVALYPWVEQQQLLLSLVQTLNSTLVLDEVLEQVLDAAMSLTLAERGFLLLAEDQASVPPPQTIAGLHVRACRRRDGHALEPELRGMATRIVARTVERGEVFFSNDLQPDPVAGETSTFHMDDPRCAVCLPMRSPRAQRWGGDGRHDVLGALYLDNYAVPFSPETLRAVEALARHAALAIENARLFEGERRTTEELRRTQKQLLHSEKLATIGMMAAGIAHELNTPLTYILGNLELLSTQDMPATQRECLTSITKGAQRLNSLAQNLLAFSRPAREEAAAVDLNALVQRCLELCHYQILKSGVSVRTVLDPDVPCVRAIQGQIDTALINLIVNAIQVMGSGGCLTITTCRAGEMVEVQIADTGPGIPEEVRASIFEPFVTTKPEGQGTGLGLSTTLLIVERHQGRIDFTSAAGAGTTFQVALPAVRSPKTS